MATWLPPPPKVEGEFVCPLPLKQLQSNAQGKRLFLYLRKGMCAVNTRDFSPVETDLIVGVGLSDSNKEIILKFRTEYTTHEGTKMQNPVRVPLVTKDLMIRVFNDGRRAMSISTFDVMSMLKMPNWTPPDYLRFPPRHLRHFYRVTDHDAGSGDSDTDINKIRFCQRMEQTEKVPLYVYSDGVWFLTPSSDEKESKMMWRIPREPHWKMENRKPMSEGGFYSITESCRVHGIECVLKTMRAEPNKPKQSEITMAKELLVTLMLSIFDVGPEVLDFWYDARTQSVCLLMKKIDGTRVFDVIESFPRGTAQHEEYTRKLKSERVRGIRGALGMSIQQALKSVNITHKDMHARNAMIDRSGRIVPLDYGQVALLERQQSRSFHTGQESVKRPRIEQTHDEYRRQRDPLPPPSAAYMDAEYLNT